MKATFKANITCSYSELDKLIKILEDSGFKTHKPIVGSCKLNIWKDK